MNTSQEANASAPATVAHTPGPWKLSRRSEVTDSEGEPILVIGVALPCGNHPKDAEAAANARLIAAAPELLEQLKEANAWLSEMLDRHNVRLTDVGRRALDDIRAAIAKAEGRAT